MAQHAHTRQVEVWLVGKAGKGPGCRLEPCTPKTSYATHTGQHATVATRGCLPPRPVRAPATATGCVTHLTSSRGTPPPYPPAAPATHPPARLSARPPCAWACAAPRPVARTASIRSSETALSFFPETMLLLPLPPSPAWAWAPEPDTVAAAVPVAPAPGPSSPAVMFEFEFESAPYTERRPLPLAAGGSRLGLLSRNRSSAVHMTMMVHEHA